MPLPIAILAGGMATRLRPLTEKIPKALIDVGGEPFIVHQLKLLKSNGLIKVVICAGFLGQMIQEVIGNGQKLDLLVDYSFDGESLLGTGGSIKKALPLLGPAFFVVYGDSYLPCDYRAVQESFESSGRIALMTIYHNRGAWDTSNIEFREGQILSYDKRSKSPRMEYIDYGLGVFQANAFDLFPDGKPYDLAEVYKTLLDRSELAAMEIHQRFYEIGSWQGLEETKQFLAKK
jgi:N-acetyl-alpha-D-muramate 1-phosphate uridylyltransferase